MSTIGPWEEGEPVPPSRFGLSPLQWLAVLRLHRRYATNSHGDIPEQIPPPQMRFVKHLVETGRLTDD